jgi:hypothetical protein
MSDIATRILQSLDAVDVERRRRRRRPASRRPSTR